MKILFVTTSFPRWAGDARAPFILEAARAIHRRGVDVRVLAMHTPGSKSFEIWDGIEIYRPQYLPERWEILQSEGGGLPEVWKKMFIARLVVLPFLIVHIIYVLRLSRGCDLIHSNWTLSSVAAWISSWFHKKPMFTTVQGSDIFQAVKIPAVGFLTRLALSANRKIFALSRALANELISLGIPSGKIVLIPNGVDINKFPKGETARDQIILFVASLIKRKGLEFLIRAFTGLILRFPSSQLIIIGEGPLRNSLEKMASAQVNTSKIIFLGGQTQEQVSEWMRRAKIFILPSLEEGLGVVLLEALASGTPCIGSNVGGIPDVISPDVGVLVPPADSQALQTAIETLLINEIDWLEYSRNARHRAEREYSWDEIALKILGYYSLGIY